MSNILVFGHQNPDNDAIMSAVMFRSSRTN